VHCIFKHRVNCPYICFGFNKPSLGGPKFYMYYTFINSYNNVSYITQCEYTVRMLVLIFWFVNMMHGEYNVKLLMKLTDCICKCARLIKMHLVWNYFLCILVHLWKQKGKGLCLTYHHAMMTNGKVKVISTHFYSENNCKLICCCILSNKEPPLRKYTSVTFEVLTIEIVKNRVFWDVTPCSLVDMHLWKRW
jgi:hypothetical protein